MRRHELKSWVLGCLLLGALACGTPIEDAAIQDVTRDQQALQVGDATPLACSDQWYYSKACAGIPATPPAMPCPAGQVIVSWSYLYCNAAHTLQGGTEYTCCTP
jgi:hypothetical protein